MLDDNIEVTYGPHSISLPLLHGFQIGDVALSMKDVFGLPDEPETFVNGIQVPSNYELRRGDRLEFTKSFGKKEAWDETDRVNLERIAAALERLVAGVQKRLVENGSAAASPAKEEDLILNQMEQNIVQALGTDTLIAEVIAEKAGYPNHSTLRTTLSGLIRRGLLEKVPSKGRRKGGYRRPDQR